MKNDNLFYHPDDYDFFGSVASLFLKKASGTEGLLALIKNPYLYIGFEYMDLKSFGIFSSIASYFADVYMDDGVILFYIEGKNNKEKNWWSYSDFDWCDMCISLRS